jgi:eukaryotic-like serine/threonine-protein kinase
MGEVYRARDTRLGRDVAIKVLPEHLSSNPDVRARFEREAKTVSGLNHPHICTLHDVGREGDTDFLVMELIEGETLATRVAKGALPVGETLRIGVQIADALDRAHRAGVIHRDLKPGNIMLTKSGAKLMDFGLARATSLVGGGQATGVTVGMMTQSPTVGQPLTAEGTIIGTFQYMAPEQLEGKETDARVDLWALGCVLYEMATGNRAFDGKSQASLITSIMGSQPAPISTVMPVTPPALDRLVSAMLTKDPADRVQSAHDVKLQLQWMADGGSSTGAPAMASGAAAARRRANVIPWIVAGVAILAAAAMGWQSTRHTEVTAPSVHATITPPPGVLYSSSTDSPLPLAISRDGRMIAFCARTGEGPDMLWVRSIDAADARPIPGTEGAEGPFFSPDGKSIGFFARGHMKRVDVAGGAVVPLLDPVDPRGASWNPDGTILFGMSAIGPLWKIGEDGGGAEPVTVLDSTRAETTHRYPCYLPDGKHFLYLARASGAGAGRSPTVFVGAIGSSERTPVLEVASNVAYASGCLLYIREGVLVAQKFDPKTFNVSGGAVPLVEDPRWDERFSRAVYAVSDNGVLVCMTGRNQTRTQLQWIDRSGALIATIGEPADYTYGGTPELSPDGVYSVMPIANRERGTSDIWIVDLTNGRRRRLTVDQEDHSYSIWHPGGGKVLVSTGAAVTATFSWYTMDGAELESVAYGGQGFVWPRSVSPDGRTVLLDAPDVGRGKETDMELVSFDGDKRATAILPGEGIQAKGQFSPSGRFFAYQSDESGRFEVYVAAYPSGGKWQVSQEGGSEARWRDDERELFYVDRDNFIVSVEITTADGTFDAGSTNRLFPFHGAGGEFRYDVSADGKRFLVTSALAENLALPVTVITDWTRKVASR